MEDTLGVSNTRFPRWLPLSVLILVLMEDTLGVNSKKPLNFPEDVLILVLMEDTLGEWVPRIHYCLAF